MLNAPPSGDADKTSGSEARPRIRPSRAATKPSARCSASDDRIQIANTKVYPFTAIGYLESKDVEGRI